MSTSTSSVFCFADDLLGEGIPSVLDRLRDAGVDAITLAATYHQSRDIFPHHPAGVVRYLESGSCAFQPTAARYGSLSPTPGRGGRDLLAEVVDAASQRDMRAAAWTVVLHNSRLGHAHPEATIRNALGDRLRHALCPANPEVRRYATTLAGELAERGVAAVRLEALDASGFDHGETHERAIIHLGEYARFLLGLCFCDHCRAVGQADDVDVDAVARGVADLLAAVLKSHAFTAALPALTPVTLEELLGSGMGDYLRARERTVTSLAAEVSQSVHAASATARVVLLDPAGAALGYATGHPTTPEPATSLGWRSGLDLTAVSDHADIGALCYFADPARTTSELAAYRSVLRPHANLEAIVRPTWPDATGPDELTATLRAVRAAGVADLHFYAYGLIRLESFDWIRHALTSENTTKDENT